MTNHKRESIEELVAQVLDGTELRLTVDSYALRENLEDGQVELRCDVHHDQTGEKKTIEGKGVGVIDAFFHGLVNLYSAEFPSLTTIQFSDFTIRARLDTGNGTAKSDSTAEVHLRVASSSGHEWEFVHVSPSITRAAIYVVLEATEFFINTERAYVAVYKALEHAKKANRADSVQRYTRQLSTLVEATSYSEVIAQMKRSSEA